MTPRQTEWVQFARSAAVDGVLTIDNAEYVDLIASFGLLAVWPLAPGEPLIVGDRPVRVVEHFR